MSASHQSLQQVITAAIENAGGKIPFSQFMQMALYEPGLGYYSSGLPKFGKEGDFITAPEISSLFSSTLANQVHAIQANLPTAKLLEFGAGSGVMAAEILLRLEALNSLPAQYCIVEVSADLQARQQATLAARCPQLIERVQWLSSLPSTADAYIVLANEVLDAMPVERFQLTEQGLKQAYVTIKESQLDLVFENELTVALQQQLKLVLADVSLPTPYQSEVNLMLKPWLASVSDFVSEGVVLLIDYGYGRNEFYHPARHRGSLQCFRQHQVNHNPLQDIGLQDITADVDFTAVAEAAVDHDFSVLGFSNQTTFLLNNGLLDFVNDIDDNVERFNRHQQIKQLTLPNEMGEKFKVLALGKQFNHELQGFSFGDKLYTL